ncbi:Nitrilase/cyanide hydratase and apolipoprotein N-acyltransferase [Nitrosopumilaceae archaeon]|nr:carbon-nitrogen hydrolase family protein [Nitrosopumilus sp.]MDA7955338.1 carbon-nitrogen hydrolase family protein [Nitrosopumilus sp.]MDA7973704.1 carbon-nitrogen hydrolase family protein [Nitrosopumilus sp.]CAI9831796.1 Nitrilase/cyanide hydratase and apolipoprotein N-acyltransferase [Nitrosopumilaceae archaeon]
MKAALVQMRSSTDKQGNLDHALASIRRAAGMGASLCAFPEFLMAYSPESQTAAGLRRIAEPVAGPFVGAIASASAEHGIDVVATTYELGAGGRIYDTCVVISAGRIASRYRKVHLYDALGFRESAKLARGARLSSPVDTGIGRIGTMICYDLRFPEVSRHLALSGSDVLVAPSAWVRGPMKTEHWITMNRARAMENGCYVLAPAQVGNIYCGRSLAVDPFGRVIADMGSRRGIKIVQIDPEKVKSTRRSLPLLSGRRPSAYRS